MEAALLVKKLRSEFAGPFELSLGIGTCAAITGSSGSGKGLFLRMPRAQAAPSKGETLLPSKCLTNPVFARGGRSNRGAAVTPQRRYLATLYR
jgi:ABC-type lipoprotein export system ATPase subunit